MRTVRYLEPVLIYPYIHVCITISVKIEPDSIKPAWLSQMISPGIINKGHRGKVSVNSDSNSICL